MWQPVTKIFSTLSFLKLLNLTPILRCIFILNIFIFLDNFAQVTSHVRNAFNCMLFQISLIVVVIYLINFVIKNMQTSPYSFFKWSIAAKKPEFHQQKLSISQRFFVGLKCICLASHRVVIITQAFCSPNFAQRTQILPTSPHM